jgi:hypothetical protein
VSCYLVPADVAARDMHECHRRWLDEDPKHSRTTRTRVLHFWGNPRDNGHGFDKKWAEYHLGETSIPQLSQDDGATDIGTSAGRPTTQDLLGFAAAGLSVLRGLTVSEQVMTYGNFAKAIGLVRDGEAWHPQHRTLVGLVLNVLAATAAAAGEPLPEFRRIVNQRTGEPGAGLNRPVRLTRTSGSPAP